MAVSVRGRTGLALTTGAGYSVFWVEDGQPYAIVSTLGLQDVLQVAAGLKGLDLVTWCATLHHSQHGPITQPCITWR